MRIASVNDYWNREQEKNQQLQRAVVDIKYATVIQLTLQGEPIITFFGESIPSGKTYRRMKHYVPAIGDTVMLINNVIIGGWPPSNI